MNMIENTQISSHICIGLVAHVDAGKTTLSEALLYQTGAIRSLGRVDHQDTYLDTDAQERERGITIFSKQARIADGEWSAALLDTPGHVDFSAEMERTLQVLDYAVLVISGTDGVQAHTRTLWKLLRHYEVPVFLFVNKMDLPGADREQLMAELKSELSDACVDFSVKEFSTEHPMDKFTCTADALSENQTGMSMGVGEADTKNANSGVNCASAQRETIDFYKSVASAEHPMDKCYEDLAVCSEEMLDAYMETGSIPIGMIRGAISHRLVFPCFFGSALKSQGVAELLMGLKQYTQAGNYPADFAARVYKIGRDARGERLTYLKLTGGTLSVKDTVRYATARQVAAKKSVAGLQSDASALAEARLSDFRKQNSMDDSAENGSMQEKIEQIRLYSGEKYDSVTSIRAGEVCAVTGLSQTYPGQGLGAEKTSNTAILEPVLTYQIFLPKDVSPIEMSRKLKQLEEEDPQLHVVWDEELQELHIQMMGQVQIEVLTRQILERFGVAVVFGPGNIVYKETIAKPVEGIGHFEPLRHYAEVHILLEPGEPGSGIQAASACSTDVLDANWQRLIATHILECEHRGVLTGSVLTDVKCTILAGRAHPKHTEGGDFRKATYRAIRQGLKKTESVLLEPYYRFILEIPMADVGRAMTDLERLFAKFGALETVHRGLDAGGSGLASSSNSRVSSDGTNQASLRTDSQIGNSGYSGGSAGGYAGASANMVRLTGRGPVSTLQPYIAQVHAYTHGLGSLAVELDGYDVCHNSEEVIAEKGYDSEADLKNPTGSVFCAHGSGFVVPWDEVERYMHLELVWHPEKKGTKAVWGAALPDSGGLTRQDTDAAGWPDDEDSAWSDVGDTAYPDGFSYDYTGQTFGPNRSRPGRGSWEKSVAAMSETELDAELADVYAREFGMSKADMEDAARRKWKKDRAKESRPKGPTVKYDQKGNPIYPKKKPSEEYLIVDGYNVIFAWEELKELARVNIDSARDRLKDILLNYQAYRKCRLLVVFDAYRVKGNSGRTEVYDGKNRYASKAPHGRPTETSIRKEKPGIDTTDGIIVAYTKEDETADAFIERTVHELGGKYRITVATSDNLEQMTVLSMGALRMSALGLKEEIERSNREIFEAYTVE